jgi:O-antigen ligase
MFKSKSQVRSFEGRMHLWRASVDIVEQHPWTGVGTYNFPMRYAAYTEDHTAIVVSTFNYFLQILAERGALGLLAYSLLLFAFFKTSAAHIKLCKSELHRLTAILFVASFAAVIVRDLTYSSILINKGANAVLWLMFAASARPEA